MKIVLIILLAINLLTFALYGIDKWKAIHHRWRIPEWVLLTMAALLGGIGAWIGMKTWHHKTLHKKFRYGVPAIVIVELLLFVGGGSQFFLWFALSNKHHTSPADSDISWVAKDYPFMASWTDSIALRDTFITNDEGLRLHAFMLDGKPGCKHTAIVVHGYKQRAIKMMHIAWLFNEELGLNVLLPDLQGHGHSDGTYVNMGCKDRRDVLQWAEVAENAWPECTIIMHGISMGGATIMAASGEEEASKIAGFIDDCGYTSTMDEFAGEMKNQFGLPPFPLLYTTSFLCKLEHGWSFDEATPLEQVARCHKPMLFIHGGDDSYVPTAMVYRLYDAKPGPKSLWVVPGATHAQSFNKDTDGYIEHVRAFVEGL